MATSSPAVKSPAESPAWKPRRKGDRRPAPQAPKFRSAWFGESCVSFVRTYRRKKDNQAVIIGHSCRKRWDCSDCFAELAQEDARRIVAECSDGPGTPIYIAKMSEAVWQRARKRLHRAGVRQKNMDAGPGWKVVVSNSPVLHLEEQVAYRAVMASDQDFVPLVTLCRSLSGGGCMRGTNRRSAPHSSTHVPLTKGGDRVSVFREVAKKRAKRVVEESYPRAHFSLGFQGPPEDDDDWAAIAAELSEKLPQAA